MRHESSGSEAMRKKYWATREKLEKVPTGVFTVGQLKEVLRLVSDDTVPRSFGVSTQDLIYEMEQYIPKRKKGRSIK